MALKKFKTFEEAEMDLWNFYPDSEWLKNTFKIFRISKFRKKAPVKKGITKFRSFKEAQENE